MKKSAETHPFGLPGVRKRDRLLALPEKGWDHPVDFDPEAQPRSVGGRSILRDALAQVREQKMAKDK